MTAATALAAALDALAGAGAAAGLDATAARTEGERLAAAVAESSPGAPADWLAGTTPSTAAHDTPERPDDARPAAPGGLQPFFDAAVSARRWRSAPTDLLAALVAAGSPHGPAYAEALAAVVDAAAALGDPSISAIAAAEGTKAVHRGAARGLDRAPAPRPAVPDDVRRSGPADPPQTGLTADPPARPPVPEPAPEPAPRRSPSPSSSTSSTRSRAWRASRTRSATRPSCCASSACARRRA
nr:hypothetical protein GCM10025730_17340 [Promicromonospora thailandica]